MLRAENMYILYKYVTLLHSVTQKSDSVLLCILYFNYFFFIGSILLFGALHEFWLIFIHCYDRFIYCTYLSKPVKMKFQSVTILGMLILLKAPLLELKFCKRQGHTSIYGCLDPELCWTTECKPLSWFRSNPLFFRKSGLLHSTTKLNITLQL